MKNKYVFADLTVYMRTKDGDYINLTDYEIEKEVERLSLNSAADFVLMTCSFLYASSCYGCGIKVQICEVTLDDLVVLAGFKDKKFLNRLNVVCKKSYGEMLAIMCAKKIVDYNYGKIILVDKENNEYSFCRQKFDESRHKISVEVLKKQFFTI